MGSNAATHFAVVLHVWQDALFKKGIAASGMEGQVFRVCQELKPQTGYEEISLRWSCSLAGYKATSLLGTVGMDT